MLCKSINKPFAVKIQFSTFGEKMLPKIRYRLVYNYSGRLNRVGQAPVAIECRQGTKKIYLSSNVMIMPDQWQKGMVVNHDNAAKLTAWLIRWRNGIEEIELDALLHGHQLSLYQLKVAVKTGLRAKATLGEFIASVIEPSDRGKTTKQGYRYLADDIEKNYGRVTIEDVTHDFVERYRADMKSQHLSENTVKGRLKQLRCLVNEAMKRNLITDDPFKFITIGNMTARVGYLEESEVRRIERLKLKGKEEKVRDLFLLSCYTGLRWSDLSTLDKAEVKDGILHKRMIKTGIDVHIPIDTLFWGKGKEILEKYPDVRKLCKVCCNTTANRILKELAQKAGIKKRCYFHLGRKTCSSMLNALGLPLQDISQVLGHAKSDVTQRHYLFNNGEHLKTMIGSIFQKKSKRGRKNQQISDVPEEGKTTDP